MSPARGAVIPASHLDRDRAHEDIVLLAQLGASVIRVGVDWPWMQPAAGEINGDAAEFYSALTQTARGAGVSLQFALLEREVPKWFDNEGGFADAKWAGHWWPRWVQVCAESFGDDVGGWVPIDHPMSVANRLFPNDPRRHGEVLDTVVTAWRDAWRILRGGPPVSTSFGLEIVRPVDQTIPAEHNAKRLDQIRFRLWFQALRDGTASIPGRADREVADLAGSFDVLGVMVRHENDTLGLLHRAVDEVELTGKPLTVTYALPTGRDADRELAVERFGHQIVEAATGLPLETAFVTPTFDLVGDERGIITRDRDLKDSGRMLFGTPTP
ncbi:MAG: Beta-glucosidase [Ilumatobacteraceae bacterium]|nr:Beta-glucosidase [Ilumatobacteraceae bacterium]